MGEKESVHAVTERYNDTIPQALNRMKKRSRSDEHAERPAPKRQRGLQAPPSSPCGRMVSSGIDVADIQQKVRIFIV